MQKSTQDPSAKAVAAAIAIPAELNHHNYLQEYASSLAPTMQEILSNEAAATQLVEQLFTETTANFRNSDVFRQFVQNNQAHFEGAQVAALIRFWQRLLNWISEDRANQFAGILEEEAFTQLFSTTISKVLRETQGELDQATINVLNDICQRRIGDNHELLLQHLLAEHETDDAELRAKRMRLICQFDQVAPHELTDIFTDKDEAFFTAVKEQSADSPLTNRITNWLATINKDDLLNNTFFIQVLPGIYTGDEQPIRQCIERLALTARELSRLLDQLEENQFANEGPIYQAVLACYVDALHEEYQQASKPLVDYITGYYPRYSHDSEGRKKEGNFRLRHLTVSPVSYLLNPEYQTTQATWIENTTYGDGYDGYRGYDYSEVEYQLTIYNQRNLLWRYAALLQLAKQTYQGLLARDNFQTLLTQLPDVVRQTLIATLLMPLNQELTEGQWPEIQLALSKSLDAHFPRETKQLIREKVSDKGRTRKNTYGHTHNVIETCNNARGDVTLATTRGESILDASHLQTFRQHYLDQSNLSAYFDLSLRLHQAAISTGGGFPLFFLSEENRQNYSSADYLRELVGIYTSQVINNPNVISNELHQQFFQAFFDTARNLPTDEARSFLVEHRALLQRVPTQVLLAVSTTEVEEEVDEEAKGEAPIIFNHYQWLLDTLGPPAWLELFSHKNIRAAAKNTLEGKYPFERVAGDNAKVGFYYAAYEFMRAAHNPTGNTTTNMLYVVNLALAGLIQSGQDSVTVYELLEAANSTFRTKNRFAVDRFKSGASGDIIAPTQTADLDGLLNGLLTNYSDANANLALWRNQTQLTLLLMQFEQQRERLGKTVNAQAYTAGPATAPGAQIQEAVPVMEGDGPPGEAALVSQKAAAMPAPSAPPPPPATEESKGEFGNNYASMFRAYASSTEGQHHLGELPSM